MTRVLPWSDLHMEKWGDRSPILKALRSGGMPEHDVLVIAGDICENPTVAVEIAGALTSSPVVMVLGNHECFGHIVGHEREETIGLARTAARGTNVTVLEGDSAIIEGVRFVGGTLWTDFNACGVGQPLEMIRAGAEMYEYAYGLFAGEEGLRSFTPADALALHLSTVAKIEAVLDSQVDMPTVMVTHHAPSLKSIAPRYARDPLNGAFASNLERLFMREGGPCLAIHGHIHTAVDYRIGATRIVANPMGYPGEATGFALNRVIEV